MSWDDRGRFPIDASLVRRLISAQFPEWADLPVEPVLVQGNDNRTFRLGAHMSVRLPSAPWYAAGVAKEQLWLPRLAAHLPVAIPKPLAMGAPGEGYPCEWSIYRWLEGDNAATTPVNDLQAFAAEVAGFLVALQSIDASDGPIAGAHSFNRGASLELYDMQTREAIDVLGERIDSDDALEVWSSACNTTWTSPPVWLHGDIASTNLLVERDRLAAVIDFGCCGVGDPACDLAIAWTFFTGKSRSGFKSLLSLDEGTWARGRAWALWKALILLARRRKRPTIWTHNPNSGRSIVNEVIADLRGR